MKNIKIFILALIIAIGVLFVSCTSDPTEGVFSQVAHSAKTSSYTIKQSLGNLGNKHYFISTKGLQSVTISGKVGTLEISGDFSSGYMTGSDIYYINANKIYKTTITNTDADISASVWTELQNETVSTLSQYGQAFTTDRKIIFLNNPEKHISTSTDCKRIDSVRYAEGAVLAGYNTASNANDAEVKYYKYFITTGSDLKPVAALNKMQVIGFQKASSGTYYAVAYEYDSSSSSNYYIYKIYSSGSDWYASNTGKYIDYPASAATQMPSFACGDFVVFRSAAYFEEYDTVNNTLNSCYTGYAETMHSSSIDIVNFLPIPDKQGYFYAATYENGIMCFKFQDSNEDLDNLCFDN